MRKFGRYRAYCPAHPRSADKSCDVCREFVDRGQFEAGFGSKLRVERQDFDGESHLIDDALAGSVTRAEKLKITRGIVGLDPVDVVNGFVSGKSAAKFLFNHVAVLVDVFTSDTIDARKSEQDVTPHHSSRHRAFGTWAQLFISRNQILSLKSAATRVAASFGSGFAVTGGFKQRTANRTGLLGYGCAADVRTSSGTVKRVFSEDGMVSPKLPGVSRERFSARFAREDNRLNFVSLTSVLSFVGFVARERAVFAARILGLYRKRLIALVAVELNRHLSPHVINTAIPYGIGATLSTEGPL